jgi:hypothetical protein
VTSDQAPRQNRDGHPCSPWCETDHDEVHGPAGTYLFHGGPPADIEVLGVTGLPDKIITRAFHVGHPGFDPVVSVASVRYGTGGQRPQAWIPASEAVALAGIIDMLDDWDQVRALVAAIRQAAAAITAPQSGEPAACPDHRPVLDSAVGWYCPACGSDAPPDGSETDGGQP